jgi:hypothetical protein
MNSDRREGSDRSRQESDLLAQYLVLALKWDSLQGEARKANAVFDRAVSGAVAGPGEAGAVGKAAAPPARVER